MKTIKHIFLLSLSIMLLFIACKDDDIYNNEEPEPGTTPIELAGLSLKNDGVTGANIYLKAFLTSPANVYLGETLINFSGGLTSTAKDVVFPIATPYYPVGGVTPIDIFAYSGKLQDDRMVVVAGNGAAYDAVLSNYGTDANNTLSTVGSGTRGSSITPAKLLYFRHIMTQLVVDLEVNNAERPDSVSPAPKSIRFTMDGVAANGLYPIRADFADTARSSKGNYAVTLGTNYLVANGQNLTGRHLKSLVIDNYTATADDLSKFTIQVEGSNTDTLLLKPGYSYNLTFTVNRLRVTGARIRQIPWQTVPINGTIDYDAYPLNLSLGSNYDNSGEDAITKVILHTGDNKMYVGESENNSSSISFVTLPASNVIKADLYTAKGLLLSTPITNEYSYASNTGTLAITTLSKGGMLPVSPASAYDPVNNPYSITTSLQFVNIRKDTTASYRQNVVVNMDLVDDNTFNGFENFKGTYDGNGYWISALNIKGSGLFASNTGTLKNIRLFSGAIDATGQSVAGSICGRNSGTIVSCFNEAMIINAPGAIGGICGQNSGSGLILACLNTGNILNGSTIGGICGNNTNINAGAIAACINTGGLYRGATTVGGICGTSTASANNVVRASFWLVGTAAPYIGASEFAVGSKNVGLLDCSALNPSKLRNGLNPGETEDKRVINRLNAAISAYAQWSTVYHYIINGTLTGSTWPVPVKQ